MPVIRDFFDELRLSVKKVNDEVRQMFLFFTYPCAPDLQLSNHGPSYPIVSLGGATE